MTADGVACLVAGAAVGILFREELFDIGYQFGRWLGDLLAYMIFGD